MALTLEELNQLLTHWENQIAQISHLEEELKTLNVKKDSVKEKIILNRLEFVGMTASELKTVLDEANEVLPYFTELEKTYQWAVSQRQTIQPWGATSRIEEIIERLTNQSLVISLGKCSPTRLIEHLLNSLEKIKLLIKDIDNTITSNKAALEISARELVVLQQINPVNQSENLQPVQDIKASIAILSLILKQDPLGTKLQIEEQVLSPLNQLGKKIQYLIQEKTRLQQELVERYPLLEELKQVHAQTLIVYTQSYQKGLLPETAAKPLTDNDLDALTQWWTRLKTKLAQGWIEPVQIGLVNWTKNVQECTTKEHQIWQVSRAVYEQSQEK